MGFWVGFFNRRNWWSTAKPKMSGGAPFRLNKYVSRTRFEVILGYICNIYQNDVEFYDGFFRMCKMEEAWNFKMSEEFNPSSIDLFGEIMMDWFNKYAPIFMCVGRKPHNFGN